MLSNSLSSPRNYLFVMTAFCLFCLSSSQQRLVAAEPIHLAITVPFTGDKNDDVFRPHQLVAVKIQADLASSSIPATLAFDTGTDHSCISASFAQKLGLSPVPATVGGFIGLNFAGKQVSSVEVAILEVGGLRVKDFLFIVLPDQSLPGDGILGTDFCSSFGVRIDFTHRQLTLIVPITNGEPTYNTLNQNSVQLSATDIKQEGFDQALTIPLFKYGTNFYVGVTLRNGTLTSSDLLVVDSGGYDTSLSTKATKKLNLQTVAKSDAAGMLGKYTADIAWLPSLSAGGFHLENLLVRSTSTQQPNPNLGLDVLANYDILFDFPHLKLYLKPRSDLQAITLRQYEAASPVRRRQLAQNLLCILYPVSTRSIGFAIPYNLSSDGLPVAQVKSDASTLPISFLLRSSTSNVYVSETLARRWHLTPQSPLDDAGKPRLIDGYALHLAQVPKLQIGGSLENAQVGVLPDEALLPFTSYLPLSGAIGANFLFLRPLLMDPTTQTWMPLTGFHPEDLLNLEMADAAAVDILDPDKDGIPAVAVQVQQGAMQFNETMILATGSPFTLLSAQAAKALKLTPEPQKLTYGAGKDITVFNQAHISQISIGGVVLKNVLVAYPIGAMPDDFVPRLGMNVISKLRLLVDAPAKKMYVKIATPEKAGN